MFPRVSPFFCLWPGILTTAVRTSRNHCFLDSDHCDIAHGRRPISFVCRCGTGHHRNGNFHCGADDPMTVDTRYPYYDRIDACLAVSSGFEAQSGELEPPSFG